MISPGTAPGALATPAGERAPHGSERVRLARLARAAALQVPGVVTADPGPAGLCVTAGGAEQVQGVRCVAAGATGYEVSLCLVCRLVGLHRLGEQVGAAVRGAASAAGIAVAAVHVHVVDVEVE